MKYIEKRKPPESLERYKETAGANFDDLPSNVKSELKQQLADEQGDICCYCGKRIFPDHHSVIEHLLPKGDQRYTHLQLAYSNLMCSCDGGEQERTGRTKREKKLFPSHCDDKKNDSIIPVTPLDENVESLFSYDDEGHIYGRTPDARKTIEILNLDCSTIVHRRKAAFDAYTFLKLASDEEWESEIIRLSKRNKDNQYEEYCFAVTYFIKNYLMTSAG